MKRTFPQILPALLIAIICFLVYSNTFKVSFQYDDSTGIVENRCLHLKELSLSKLVSAATEGRYSNRPVSQLSFSLNYYFGGLNVFGYHLVNLLIHALAGVILYFLLVITLNLGPLKGKYERREQLALFIVLLWVVHPVQTQSVTYILQRMTSMAGMFYLLSLYLYVRGRLGETRGFKAWCYSGSVAAGVLALGSKEVAGVLPLMLVLYEFYFFQNLDFRVIRRKWLQISSVLVAFFIIVLVYLGPNFIGKILANYQGWDFTLGERLLTQGRVVMYYLSLLVFPLPSRLNLDYDFSTSQSLFNPVSTLLSLLGLIGFIGLGVYLARRRPLASFGIFWFLGNLAVESSIIPLEMVFEHRLYLPLLGFLLFLVGIAGRKVRERGFVYGAFSVILIFSIWTFQRNIVWSDEFTLWSDCLKKSPNKAGPHNNLGNAYINKEMFDEAIREYQRALDIDPDYAEAYKAYTNLGFAYLYKGMYDEAIRECQRALRINPNYAKAHTNLGIAYLNKGMYDEAIREYQRALDIDPNYGRTHLNLGIAYTSKGMHDEAIREYQQALRLEPNYAEAYNNLGIAYANKGMDDEAIREYQRALQVNPDYAEAYNNLGIVYANKGMHDEAIREYQRALHIDPDYANADKIYNNLGSVYLNKGMNDEAIREYQKALQINPDYARAHTNLGIAYFNKEKYDEAVKEYQKALEIKPDFAEAHYKLGVIYYHRKQYNLSVRHIKNAEKLGYPIPLEFKEMLQRTSKGLKK